MNSTDTIKQTIEVTANQKSILDVEVSCYSCYYITDKTPPPISINLLSFLKSAKYKNEVQEIRSIENKESRDAKKALLPAITVSGTFAGSREDKDLIKHSGLMQFDIDFKDNQHLANYDQLKQILCNVKNVAYCGLSVSGLGYWGLVPIAYPEKHRLHFRALQKAFKQFNINIDNSCINVSRLRGYSYDPDAYYNHHAIPYLAYEQPDVRKYVKSGEGPSTEDEKKVAWCVSEIEKQHIDITCEYGAWFSIGCSLANDFKEKGRNYFHAVSQFHSNYSVTATDKKYDECLRGYDYSLGTFFYYCGLVNIVPPKRVDSHPILIKLEDIAQIPIETKTGPDFGNLIMATVWMKDGRKYDLLYSKYGELVTAHEKLQPLATFFNKTFLHGKLDGVDCLLHYENN